MYFTMTFAKPGSILKGPQTMGGYFNGEEGPTPGTAGAALLQNADSCPTSLQVSI